MDRHLHTREMQGKPQDLLRQLPDAMGGRHCVIADDREVTIEEHDGRRIDLDIEPIATRKLGSLELPMLCLSFRFHGYSEYEVEEILDHFDVATMRTGGP